MQIDSGLRKILSHPAVYTGFQNLMGAHSGWKRITDQYLKMQPGESLLDIGCGPADVLDYLTEVDYWGFDISQAYIDRAKVRFPGRGHFHCKIFEPSDIDNLPLFDAALLSGVLHHLDDDEANALVDLIARALKPMGRLVTIDPCFHPGQNPVARFIISRDRGRNVRTESEYRALVSRHFKNVHLQVVHKAWIPYTHCYMVCKDRGTPSPSF